MSDKKLVPLRTDDLSPQFVLASALQDHELYRAVVVISVLHDGTYRCSLSNMAGTDLCYLKCTMDEYVRKAFAGELPPARQPGPSPKGLWSDDDQRA